MKFNLLFVTGMSLLFLVACGGGGGGGSSAAPAAPEPKFSFGIKTLQFTWPAVNEATHYRLFENPNGISGYTQIGGDITATHVEHEIALYRRFNAKYIIAACNSNGCTDSAELFVLDQLKAGIGYFKASNTNANDRFGSAVAISADGNTLAVGAFSEDSNAVGVNGDQTDNSISNAGAVYVFVHSGTSWVQQAYLKASNAGVGDAFGAAIALSANGNTLVVGAPGEYSNAVGVNGNQNDNSSPGAGAAYVFIRSGSTWSQQAYIKASNTGTADLFGNVLALSADGNVLAVGAIHEDGSSTGINGADNDLAANSGAVYLFARVGTTWTQQLYVKASNTEVDDNFGKSIALSADGNTLAVGADNEDSNAAGINSDGINNFAQNSGAVYVFNRVSFVWVQQAYVKSLNTDANDHFGSSVALSADGNTLAVGATGEDSPGIAVNDVDGNSISTIDSGAAYVYSRSGSTWSPQAYIKATNTGAGDGFGFSIALSADGNTLAVGAAYEDSRATGINGNQQLDTGVDAGAVYVYRREFTDWSRLTYVKASNTSGGDTFGTAISLSADGNTLAVSASFESSNATGINGDQLNDTTVDAGAVYLY